MTERIARARPPERSLLFVPGDRPDRFAKAAASGADDIVLDLEDAVLPQNKDEARRAVAAWLAHRRRAVLRVNGADTTWHDRDMALLDRPDIAGINAVMLPKATARTCAATAARLPSGMPLIALVETAAGLVEATAMATIPAVRRLAFGAVDFQLECGMGARREALLMARATLVVASAAAGIEGPVDGVTLDVDDPGRLASDVAHARELGFTGKLCIHPRQIAATNQGFDPTAEEIEAARKIVAALPGHAGDGALLVDGRMVDRPVIERARRTLDRAGIGTGDDGSAPMGRSCAEAPSNR